MEECCGTAHSTLSAVSANSMDSTAAAWKLNMEFVSTSQSGGAKSCPTCSLLCQPIASYFIMSSVLACPGQELSLHLTMLHSHLSTVTCQPCHSVNPTHVQHRGKVCRLSMMTAIAAKSYAWLSETLPCHPWTIGLTSETKKYEVCGAILKQRGSCGVHQFTLFNAPPTSCNHHEPWISLPVIAAPFALSTALWI